jgi:hypothetical protein
MPYAIEIRCGDLQVVVVVVEDTRIARIDQKINLYDDFLTS